MTKDSINIIMKELRKIALATSVIKSEMEKTKIIGSIGGDARAKALPPSRRSEIARLAAKVRWGGGAQS